MKNFVFSLLIAFFLLLSAQQAEAQFRSDVASPYDITGQVVKTQYQQPSNNLFDMMDVRMMHSYDASFGNFGGQYYNQNMYTNTTMYRLSSNLSGRLDVSFAHSPFGGNQFNPNQNQIFIRNAQLDYQISENSSIRVQFQQLPAGSFGFNSFGGGGFHPYGTPAHGQFWNN